jgi:hypothetical protein
MHSMSICRIIVAFRNFANASKRSLSLSGDRLLFDLVCSLSWGSVFLYPCCMRFCLSLPVLHEVLSFCTRVAWGSVFLYPCCMRFCVSLPCCMRFCLSLPVLYEVVSEALSVNMAYRLPADIGVLAYYYSYLIRLLLLLLLLRSTTVIVGRGSVAGVATCYGLHGPGIESVWWPNFPHLSRPVLGPTQPPVQWVLAAGAWR